MVGAGNGSNSSRSGSSMSPPELPRHFRYSQVFTSSLRSFLEARGLRTVTGSQRYAAAAHLR